MTDPSRCTALVVENSARAPIGALADWLPASGIDLVTVRPHTGEALPADPTAYDAVIVLGGPSSAYDDGPIDGRASWQPAGRDLLNQAVAAAVPTFAICLGAQLLAVAQGGRVHKGPDGPERGALLIAKRDRAVYDPVMAALPLTPDVIQWHDDVISELPVHAQLLAAGTRYENQAFRIGETAWGVQFHPEATPSIVRDWAARERAEGGDGELLGAAVAGVTTRYADLEETWHTVFERFAVVVRRRRESMPEA
ncbi:MAG: type 1 glutamine amidotransferase [Mycobacteriales bacterium]